MLVGLTITKLSAWLPDVALTFTTGARQASGANRLVGFGATVFGLYTFACPVGHIDAFGVASTCACKADCRREEGEKAASTVRLRRVFILFLIDAASKSRIEEDSQIQPANA